MTRHLHYWILARLAAGQDVDPAQVDTLTDAGAELARRMMNANGGGPAAALLAGLEALADPAEREDWQAGIFAADPAGDPPAAGPDDTAQAQRPAVVIHWAREALEPQPPLVWVIDQLFSEGSLSIVAGEGGSKKTWLLLDAAVAVAMGAFDWLGHTARQCTALIIDEESGLRRLNIRLAQLMRARGAGPDIPLRYTALARFDLRAQRRPAWTDEEDAAPAQPGPEDLRRAIIETGARFVVVDALADVMAGGDENAVKDVQPVFMALRVIAEETRAAIVVIHHAGKRGDYRGSTAIKGAVDAMLMIESRPDSGRVDIRFEKARDVAPHDFAAQVTYYPDRVQVDPVNATPKGLGLGKPLKYVLRHLAKNGDSTLADIMAKADTCAPTSARNAAYSLADLGLIRRVDDGGAGTPATYGLCVEADGTPTYEARGYLLG